MLPESRTPDETFAIPRFELTPAMSKDFWMNSRLSMTTSAPVLLVASPAGLLQLYGGPIQ